MILLFVGDGDVKKESDLKSVRKKKKKKEKERKRECQEWLEEVEQNDGLNERVSGQLVIGGAV